MDRKLIETSTAEKFDLNEYKHTHTDRLTQLSEAKVASKERSPRRQRSSPRSSA